MRARAIGDGGISISFTAKNAAAAGLLHRLRLRQLDPFYTGRAKKEAAGAGGLFASSIGSAYQQGRHQQRYGPQTRVKPGPQ